MRLQIEALLNEQVLYRVLDSPLTCHNCRTDCRKLCKRLGRQRYEGQECRKVFTDARDNTLDRMYLSVEKAELVLSLLLECKSVSTASQYLPPVCGFVLYPPELIAKVYTTASLFSVELVGLGGDGRKVFNGK